METEIIINRKTKAEIEKLPVNDGNIYFSTDSNEIFMDNGKSRKSYGNDKQEIDDLKNEVKKNKEDVSIKLESKGNPIVLKDSTDSSVINLELSGSTIQENIPSLEKPEEIRQGVWDRISNTNGTDKGFIENLLQTIQLSEWDKIKLIDKIWKKEKHMKELIFDGTEPDWIFEQLPSGKNIYLDRVLGDVELGTLGILSNLFPTRGKADIENINKGIFISPTRKINISGYFDSVEQFKQIIKKQKLKVYVKFLTPEYEILPQEMQDILNKIQTFYPNTTISTNEGITLNLKYMADTKKYIDNNYVLKSEYNDLLNRVETLEKNVINK